MQNFRTLRVWRQALALAINVRRATGRFPKSGYASLKDQIIRAAESIYFSIMEGCGASTPKDHARYIDVSIKSSMELEGQLEMAHAYGIVADRDWRSLILQTIDTRRMLCGYKTSVLRKDLSKSRSSRKADGATRDTHAALAGEKVRTEEPGSGPDPGNLSEDPESPPVNQTE
jgi:four helix bundle protein